MIIGYARTSKAEQNLDMQIDAIKEYAVKVSRPLKLYTDQESGAKADRAGLAQALDNVREGDVFIVYKLDRLARSTRQLYEITDNLKAQGVEFVSIADNLDTTTAAGRAMFGMLAVFAEFERNIIVDRTREGLKAARARGRHGGRPPISKTIKRRVLALIDAGESATDIAREYNIGRSTVYKIVKEREQQAQD